jgi:hypothetical protein
VSRLRAALAAIAAASCAATICCSISQTMTWFAYLSPAAMLALWHKARAEMRPGTLLLSYEFHIPGTTPDLVIQPEGAGRCCMAGACERIKWQCETRRIKFARI